METTVPTPDVKETQFINDSFRLDMILAHEMRHPRNRRGNTGSLDRCIPFTDPVGRNPFLVNSQNGGGQSSGVEVEASTGQEHYWGHVEPLPLEPHEIALPPISSPDRLSLSPQLPPLPEEEEEEFSIEKLMDSSGNFLPSRLSDLGLYLSSSGHIVIDDPCIHRSDDKVGKTMVDASIQTSSYTPSTPTDLSTNANLVFEDWDQFVFVDHDLGERSQPSSAESSIISFQDEFAVPNDSDDERLQKRMKNWPRYIQNLLEA